MHSITWRRSRIAALFIVAGIALAWSATAEEAALEVAPAEVPAAGSSAPRPAEKKADGSGLGQRGDREITVGEQMSFREQQVLEEMSELEQRMFRLSEGLKRLEPENASRLIMGVKFAREELILHQMKEVQEALGKLSLKGAIEEQRQLIAKLERLQQMLLSSDLDFEMRRQKLRDIRNTLRKLDAVIKEEVREEKISKATARKEKELAELTKRREAIEALVKQQAEHNEKNAPLAKAETPTDEQKSETGKLKDAQEATRAATKDLADQLIDGASPKNLVAAAGNMKSAVEELGKPASATAQPKMEQALEDLKKELDEVAKQEAAAKEALAKDKLEAMKKDQEANRASTEEVTDMTRQLGNSGAGSLSELMRASGSMSNAEGAFGKGQAGEGNSDQNKALAALKYAEEQLAEEAERLARELRREVKKRVTEGLTQMLELQTAVRESTAKLSKGVSAGSREALSALTSLAKREDKITGLAQDMINIVEETEFGIALPAALAAVRDATEAVGESLTEGDASDEVVKAEKQIEADLKAMLEVVNEMSDANSKKGQRGGNSSEEQRKEQNRIISELKMIRLLEVRVNQSTSDVETKRATAQLSPAIRKRIEGLEGRQDDIRAATEQLANERSEEIPQQE